MTRAKVLQMAGTLGYQPNLAARALSSRKTTRVAVVLPQDPWGFFASVNEGILEAARAAEPAGVVFEAGEYPWLDAEEVEAIEAAIESGANGPIVAPGLRTRSAPRFARHPASTSP